MNTTNHITPIRARGNEKDKIVDAITALGGNVIDRGLDSRRKMIVSDFTGAETTIFVTVSLHEEDSFIFGGTYNKEIRNDINGVFHLIQYKNNEPFRKFILRGDTLHVILSTTKAHQLLKGESDSIINVPFSALEDFEVEI